MPEKLKTVMLKEVPTEVDDYIEKEQLRLALHDNMKLKKAPVVYRIIREWYSLKNENRELRLQLQECKEELGKAIANPF